MRPGAAGWGTVLCPDFSYSLWSQCYWKQTQKALGFIVTFGGNFSNGQIFCSKFFPPEIFIFKESVELGEMDILIGI